MHSPGFWLEDALAFVSELEDERSNECVVARQTAVNNVNKTHTESKLDNLTQRQENIM